MAELKHNQSIIIGTSDAFQQVLENIKQVAPTNITVLIAGESGSGKEIIAKAIHQQSLRHSTPMLTVNCGAIPEGILESELFGHEKGSFTGATETRKGYFELADQGTLFLDEIGEMPLGTQVKLLRVLEEREFMRVGGSKVIKSDVRVIAATNRDLELAIRQGTFRKDLYYRLNTVKIIIPPLRSRKEDIRPLAKHFIQMTCENNHMECVEFTDDAYELLEEYSWPGNVRELRNLIERTIILEPNRIVDRPLLEKHINVTHEPLDRNLPVIVHKTTEQAERELIYRALIDLRMAVEEIKGLLVNAPIYDMHGKYNPGPSQAVANPSVLSDENSTLKEVERYLIERTLDRTRGNRRKTAKILGLGERTLYRKLKEYGLE